MDHKRPLRLVTIYDLLLYPLRRLAQLLGDAVQWAEAKARGSARWIRQRAGGALGARKAATGSGVGTGVLGIGGRQWDSFGEYSRPHLAERHLLTLLHSQTLSLQHYRSSRAGTMLLASSPRPRLSPRASPSTTTPGAPPRASSAATRRSRSSASA